MLHVLYTHPGVGNCIRSVVRFDVGYESYMLGTVKSVSDLTSDMIQFSYHDKQICINVIYSASNLIATHINEQ